MKKKMHLFFCSVFLKLAGYESTRGTSVDREWQITESRSCIFVFFWAPEVQSGCLSFFHSDRKHQKQMITSFQAEGRGRKWVCVQQFHWLLKPKTPHHLVSLLHQMTTDCLAARFISHFVFLSLKRLWRHLCSSAAKKLSMRKSCLHCFSVTAPLGSIS